jgi:hypothetical protein
MSEMVERVALAICKAEQHGICICDAEGLKEICFDKMRGARAAIAVLSTPEVIVNWTMPGAPAGDATLKE